MVGPRLPSKDFSQLIYLFARNPQVRGVVQGAPLPPKKILPRVSKWITPKQPWLGYGTAEAVLPREGRLRQEEGLLNVVLVSPNLETGDNLRKLIQNCFIEGQERT